jgi:hypothetical protein
MMYRIKNKNKNKTKGIVSSADILYNDMTNANDCCCDFQRRSILLSNN